jgi:hypothetical protein
MSKKLLYIASQHKPLFSPSTRRMASPTEAPLQRNGAVKPKY